MSAGARFMRIEHLDGVADVARTLLLVERTVGGEHHALGREEIDAADGRGARALDRGVAVEILEVVVGPLLQAAQHRAVVLVRGARAELVEAVADAAFEIRDHAAEMMRDDGEAGIAVDDAGEHEARERHAGLVGPAEHAADLVFRDLLGRIVRHLARARGMQQDRPAGLGDDLVDRPEFLLVERLAVGVGAELDGVGAVLEHALGLLRRRVRHVHRQHRGPADEMLGMLGDDFLQAVIGDLRHLQRLVGPEQPLDRRQAVREHLRVVRKLLDHLQPQVDVGERRNAAHALAEVLLAGGRLEQRVVIALREKMIEGVDVAHCLFPSPILRHARA